VERAFPQFSFLQEVLEKWIFDTVPRDFSRSRQRRAPFTILRFS